MALTSHNTTHASRDKPDLKGRLYVNSEGEMIEVMSVEDDEVEFSQFGGSFVWRASRAEFEANFKPAGMPGFKRGAVTADWLPEGVTVAAFHDGKNWNGWAMPCFAKDAGLQVAVHTPGLAYAADRDAFVFQDENSEDEEVFPALMLEVDGALEKVYPIGSGLWCWSLA